MLAFERILTINRVINHLFSFRPRVTTVLGLLVALASPRVFADTIRLDELDVRKTSQDWGDPRKNQSVERHPLTIAGRHFEHGLGTHAESSLYIRPNGAEKFTAIVGLDDEVGSSVGSVEFSVIGDDKVLWTSGVMKTGQAAKEVSVSLTGVKTLLLQVGDADDGVSYDHADWADAQFTFTGTAPVTLDGPSSGPGVVLTPKPSAKPQINGAQIVGVRPGHPLLYKIAATGEEPITYSASHLPKGLQLDPATGRITGKLDKAGTYKVEVHAQNKLGSAKRNLQIDCGDTITLTPPMGWNSWNCFAGAVDDGKVRAAADAMVSSGLINHGWTYINIDDCWEGKRDAEGRIQPNEKFPDMKALADYVHSKGLKIGIYSSPGPKTCAGFEASWQHEDLDAQQYAAWGFDYLKYDWCSYDGVQDRSLPDLPRFKKPYEVMEAALGKVDRDIVFSLCQYGMGDVWKWGAEVGGNCWRTTGDINDKWSSMAGIGFNQAGHEKFAGPGHWNDPDMLVVGRLGWGQLRPTHLSPDEQYTHISLWSLLAAPLLIGCDMSQMDEFTVSLLSNDEVLAVSQDPLGKQAARIAKNGGLEVWVKDMADGSKAVGLFNRGDKPATVSVTAAELGLKGKLRVRDLWRQKDLGKFPDSFGSEIPRHGVILVQIKG